MRKVRIKGLPKKQQGGQSGASEGLKRFMQGEKSYDNGLNQFAAPEFQVNKSITGVPDGAPFKINAEHNEQVIVPGQGGIPESYTVKGKRHAQGGENLNLADDAFVFSDHKKNGMKLKDKDMLAEFGINVGKKSKKKSYTFAEIAKKYDLNEDKKILLDPNSDKLARETAELNIANKNTMLGKLALVQEAKKGFPQGVPEIAMPYLQTIGVDPMQLMGQAPQGEQPLMAAFGAGVSGDPSQYSYQQGGEFKGAFWDSILQKGGQAYQTGGGLFNRTRRNQYNPMEMDMTPVRTIQAADGNWYHINAAGQYWPAEGASGEGAPAGTVSAGDPNTFYFGEGQPDTPSSNTNQVQTSNRPTKSTNIPENKKKTLEDVRSGNVSVGDYYQDGDKWYKVTSVPTSVTYQGDDAETVWGTGPDASTFSDSYAFLANQFQDPEVKAKFAEYTRKALRNKDYYKGKSGGYSEMYTEEEVANLSDDDLVNMFLTHQKRNYALQAQGVDPTDFRDADGGLKRDLSPEKKKYYQDMGVTSLNDTFGKFGVPITDEELKAGHLGLEQGSYWGYADMLRDRENLDPSLQEKLKYFDVPQFGETDEPGVGGRSNKISPIDSKKNNFYTNTTAGQLALVGERGPEAEEVPGPEKPAPEKAKDPTQPFVKHVPRDEWWAQDIGNIANLFGQRVGLKKYLPDSFPVDLARPDVLYFDPSRALAANAEQAAIAQQAAAAFAGPNATYRNTGIQGQAFANAANTLADYENKNVGVGNQYLQQVAQTENQEVLANAERMQRLFDQNTIANQQFDNAKRMANRNLFDAWRQGLTNKKMTQAMNALYPQFETIPSIGGGLYYTGVRRPLQNTGTTGRGTSGNSAYLDEVNRLKAQYPNLDEVTIRRQVDQRLGNPMQSVPQNPYQMDQAQMRNFMNMYSGIGNMAGAYPPGMIPG